MADQPDNPTQAEPTIATLVPGLAELWAETLGDPRVFVAVIDGPFDKHHECFHGANLTTLGSSCACASPTGEPVANGRAASNGRAARHGTHIMSVIFGQHDSPVAGVAPRCRGLHVPVFNDGPDDTVVPTTQLALARAITTILEHVADDSDSSLIINISSGQLAPSPQPHPLLRDVLQRCRQRGALVVAAAGNHGCDCILVPSACPGVLAVGAMDRSGTPLSFSNWGEPYQTQGILAPGRDILGAAPNGGTARADGTSYAAAIVSGVVALLVSRQRQHGQRGDPILVRDVLLQSAQPCRAGESATLPACLAGRLDLSRACELLSQESPSMSSVIESIPEIAPLVDASVGIAGTLANESTAATTFPRAAESSNDQSAAESGGVLPADCGCGGNKRPQLVYAIGELYYDFSSEARRDRILADLGAFPTPAALLAYLDDHPEYAEFITWLLQFDTTPIYAIRPAGPFAEVGYARLREFLREQLQRAANFRPGDVRAIFQVAIPGVISGQVRLLSGQVVPQIIPAVHAMADWDNATLTAAVQEQIALLAPAGGGGGGGGGAPDEAAGMAIINFLNRVYFSYRNLGTASQDRALNYAATNALQAGQIIARELALGFEIDSIEVARSGFCRPESDCWDVKLTFYFVADPIRRSRKVHLFTVDVSDVVPVTVGFSKQFNIR